MSKKKDNVDSLLAAIQRQTPAAPVELQDEAPAAPEPRQEARKRSAHPIPSQPVRVSIYIQEEDRRTIRELSAWLAGQGMRPSDSLIIRAALRLTKTGGDLLSTYRQLAQMDRRYKPITRQ
jgi:hypothetical protein